MTEPEGDDATLAATGTGLATGACFAGRFVLKHRLGVGGMGAVYAARDQTLDEDVALKLLTGAAVGGSVERFVREVRLARRVTHRNVARTFDIGEHQGLHYLTMELVDGCSLAAELERGVDLSRALAIAAQIGEGLAAAHQAGVVHRDLKPANVLLETGGRVVITDFGIARTDEATEQLTADGGMLGTLRYMAPEQVEGKPVDARTDLYALGLIMFEMVTGTRPFASETALASAMARVGAKPPDPSTHAELPAGLSAIVMQCLAADPGRRPADAHEVVRALAAIDVGAAPAKIDSGQGPTQAGSRTSFVSARRPDRGLAVLPFKYRGPADEAYLAEVLTDELIDALSMTKGLRVPASGATARFSDDRDPSKIGEALAVDAYVDGTVTKIGPKIRISARLIDTQTETQTWSEHYTSELQDVLMLQERLAGRIAETLRVELGVITSGSEVSAEAIELYLRARRLDDGTRRGPSEGDSKVSLFERCLALSPDFAPAIAGYALACIQAWFLPGSAYERDWKALAEDAVARALEKAPDLAETHYAAARLAAQLGNYALAASRLASALDRAPTYSDAHEYLGALQLESGRMREGIAHVELASELDPRLWSGRMALARHRALRGDREAFRAGLDVLYADVPQHRLPLMILELRVASWFDDHERAREVTKELQEFPGSVASGLHDLARLYIGDAELSELAHHELRREGANPRFTAMTNLMMTEALAWRGEVEDALRFLEIANQANLVDLDWIEHCAVIEGLRGTDVFKRVRADVTTRAQAIWSR